MKYAADYRRAARNALIGMWGLSVAVTLVALLLGGFGQEGISFNLDTNELPLNMESIEALVPASLLKALRLESIGRWAVPSGAFVGLMSLALFVIGGAVELGHKAYYLSLLRGGKPEFNTLFSRFSIFLKALGLRLFIMLFTFLWTLLLVIPGIIASYRYRLAPFLMAQNPGMGIREAVDESKRRTGGHKGRWFCLDLSFFGWGLLCVLTLGIGFLWLNPYTSAAEAAFAIDLLDDGARDFGAQEETSYHYRGPERL